MSTHFLLLIRAPSMSSLGARVEEQFQLCLEFLGPNVVVLRDSDLVMTIEHVKSSSPSLRVYL